MRTKAEADSEEAGSGHSAGNAATALGGGKDPHRDCGSAW
jgi:hypothetical protein